MNLRTLTIPLLLSAGLMAASVISVAKEKFYIPVVSKGFMLEFWQTVKAGSDTAARELNVKTSFVGPSDETQIAQQVQLVENILTQKPDGLLLAALDSNALLPSVERAHAQKVPVVTFDSSVNSDIPVSFVATDNKAAGAMAADAVEGLLGSKGKVAVVAHNAGTMTAADRVDGFTKQMKRKYPAINVLSPLYSEGDPQRAMNQTMDIIRANPDLSAVYATNEASTLGVASAVDSLGLAGKIKVVGFDSSDALVSFLKKGVIQGLVVQDAFQIGYVAMKTLYNALTGHDVKKVIDVLAVLVTGDNINKEEIQKIIRPSG
ncbi:ABC transporter substrate-binding protein [Endozoicomonas euniceicola]|uniref:ABC transporter substrate-binding protein n=1 Tax=Endozoicomonas euniceicola TaxID=1234143 RepID=A0ABY6GZK8_9GAMM|nr:ABC transporter substrate-binding protein [Endozoicomonas euniceicola]UYM18247.1 ABC transporter substrate-binding protein [Endozoicomonas euniceicola]